MPKYTTGTALPAKKEVESDYFRSLGHLLKHYGLQVDSYRKLPYPYNILLATQRVQE